MDPRSNFEHTVRRYWEMGLSDTEISAAAGKSASIVRFARRRMDLPPNAWVCSHEKKKNLYLSGLSDGEISRILHLTASTILACRKRSGLAPHFKRGGHRSEKDHVMEERMILYREGMNDHEIGKIQQVSPTSVLRWRKRNGLPPNRKLCQSRKKEE